MNQAKLFEVCSNLYVTSGFHGNPISVDKVVKSRFGLCAVGIIVMGEIV